MDNNVDLVSEFFANNEAAEAPAVDTAEKTIDMSRFDNAEGKIRSILAEKGWDDTYIDVIISQIRDAYDALSRDDEGYQDQTDIPALTSEVSDIISSLCPEDVTEESLAILACEIIDAITNKYILDDNGTVAEESDENVIEQPASEDNLVSFDNENDNEDDDDLGPGFWN